MKSIKLYPYKTGSQSAVGLAQALGIKTLKLVGSTFVPKKDDIIINWGSTTMPPSFAKAGALVVNSPDLLKRASNKKIFFEVATAAGSAGPAVPPWTTDKEVARTWFAEDKKITIFARTTLAGHSGEGIVKITSTLELDTLVPAGTLLCLYIPKRREFRLHVSKKGIFSIQEKKAKLNEQGTKAAHDYQIRNLANGFVFARNDLDDIPPCVGLQATKALAVTGLDFGAIDIIYNKERDQAYVLEVNTAPGLEGTTVLDYATMLKQEFGV